MNLETGGGAGRGNETDDGLETSQRLAAPVLADIGKESMLDLIPLAGTGREMTDDDPQTRFVGQFLQLEFPEPQAGTVAAPRIGRNQQAFRLRIGGLPHGAPPSPDGLDGELRGVVIHAHANPATIAAQIINAVGGSSS